MLHALDNETRRVLLPNLPTIDNQAQAILAANTRFLERAAVHAYSERLKDDNNIPESLTRHIRLRSADFLRMTRSQQDAAVTGYGWNPNADGASVSELRVQYFNVTRWCYQEGYRTLRPMWNTFLQNPVWWFNLYKEYLETDALCQSVVLRIMHGAPDSAPVRDMTLMDQVKIWMENLLMLHQAAPTATNFTGVTRVLEDRFRRILVNVQIVREHLENTQSVGKAELFHGWIVLNQNLSCTNRFNRRRRSGAKLKSIFPGNI